MRRLLCWLIGHEPRLAWDGDSAYPVAVVCARCQTTIEEVEDA